MAHVTISECDNCGAAVLDESAHREYHNRIDDDEQPFILVTFSSVKLEVLSNAPQ